MRKSFYMYVCIEPRYEGLHPKPSEFKKTLKSAEIAITYTTSVQNSGGGRTDTQSLLLEIRDWANLASQAQNSLTSTNRAYFFDLTLSKYKETSPVSSHSHILS